MFSKEILVYLRKSRADDVYETVEEVLAKHETILRDWASVHLEDGKLEETNIYREVVSGETIADRPKMQDILAAIENPSIKGVLVVEPQRLSRGDLEDIGKIVRIFKYTNTRIITPQRAYNLYDEYDKDMIERELKRGNEYLEYTKKILLRGRLVSVQQGNFIGNTAPLGYDKVLIKEGKKTCHTLKPNKDAWIVQKIFELYASGVGYNNITKEMYALTGRPFHMSTIKDMLANKHYIGKVVWNRRAEVRTVENGELKITRPRHSDYLIYDGKHEAIISDELFEAVQERKKLLPAQPTNKVPRNELARLVYCPCGHAMSLKYDGGDARLRCRNTACKNSQHSLNYNALLSQVHASAIDKIEDIEVQFQQIQAQNNRYAKEIQKIESRLSEIDDKEVALWEARANMEMPEHVFVKLKDKYISQREDLLEKKKQYEEKSTTTIDIKQLKSYKKILNSTESSVTDKNQVYHAIIDHITVIPGKNIRATKGIEIPEGAKKMRGWINMPSTIEIEFKL